MNNECITDHQGRKPCTCAGLNTANSDGSDSENEPYSTTDRLVYEARWVLLALAGVALVLALSGYFGVRNV